MPEKPNPRELRMVILFDPQDESCNICSHNLTAEDASQKLDELGDEGLLAVTLDQPSHHAAYNPDDCTACRAELAWLLAESAGNPRALKRALTSLPSPSPNL
jgi:hypothetical protein